jgi:hypothetical protein
MSYSRQGSVREQMRFLRRQFLQDGGLPFTDILSEELVSQALKAIDGFLDRIYSPLVTLWVFLGQVLSADPSCRAAVARLIVHRISRKQKPCSAETGAYCQARKRLPEKFFSDAARQTGSALDTNAKEDWLWKAASRSCLRWIDRFDARYAGEPGRLPAAGCAETRNRIPNGPHRSRLLARLWRGARSGNLPLRRQGAK